MPLYSYKAKSEKGEKIEGTIVAKDKHHLAELLYKKGYFLVSSKEKKESGEERSFFKKILSKFERVSLKEKLFFTRNLAVMIGSGAALPKSFEILSEQAETKKFKNALSNISERIRRGEALSDALKSYEGIFSRLYRETLKVGEETGNLEKSLKVLASQMEREKELKSEIKGAMVYPAMVLGIAFLIGVLMFIMVIPKLKTVFTEMNVELPFTTQLIISFSSFLTNNWILVILIGIFLIGGLIRFFQSDRTEKLRSKISLKIPIISDIVKKTNTALTLRTLSSLLSSGVPIVRALKVTGGALSNFYYRQALEASSEEIKKGEKLSETLGNYTDIFPPVAVEMMKVGEETGETSQVLERLADFYESEVKNSTERLSSVIEPFLILCVGAAVGFFAVSMMQPMFKIMQGI